MILFKPYSNIKGFLNRFTILKIGTFHIRIHKILDKDRTTLYHNHPFHYISIILKGGYKECLIDKTIKHSLFSVIIRNSKTFHRIDEVYGETITLFITIGNYGWKAFNTETCNDDGVYERKGMFAKKENGIWFIGNKDFDKASKEIRHSIHQI